MNKFKLLYENVIKNIYNKINESFNGLLYHTTNLDKGYEILKDKVLYFSWEGDGESYADSRMKNDKNSDQGMYFVSFSRSNDNGFKGRYLNKCIFVLDGNVLSYKNKIHPYSFDNLRDEKEERYYPNKKSDRGIVINNNTCKKIILEIDDISELDYDIYIEDYTFRTERQVNKYLIEQIKTIAELRGIPVELKIKKKQRKPKQIK